MEQSNQKWEFLSKDGKFTIFWELLNFHGRRDKFLSFLNAELKEVHHTLFFIGLFSNVLPTEFSFHGMIFFSVP